MIKKLYPQGKKKALILSYDDGVLQDVRLVEMLNRYGLKGTFNLNSGLMQDEFEWTHESGCVIKRLSAIVSAELYKGHEIASHTLNHPYMYNYNRAQMLAELAFDKSNLEKTLNIKVHGFAAPFEFYSDLLASCARECGFEYARTSTMSKSFDISDDFHTFDSTIFHLDGDFEQCVEEFIKTDEELASLRIVGHSYDLDIENLWDKMESILSNLASAPDVLSMTTIDLVRYRKAMNMAQISTTSIKNTSDITLWFEVNGEVVSLEANEEISLA